MTRFQTYTYRLLVLTIAALFVTAYASPVSAADLGSTGDYRITGFSFDTDAVIESDSGLQFESSRFKPLMITNSAADILIGDPFVDSISPQTSKSTPHGFAVAAEYLATPSLAFHGAIGVTKGNWDAEAALTTESSWEANIGVVYNFFNSLSYEVHFGYMDAGDVFKQSDTYTDIDSIIMISNQLTMSF
ncbi:MAG: hypothetical protein V2I35_05100 [Desulfocapsaceae bacterium]|jgi:hypothetical protein|nr:hypothetical protein [Desulfocapsaceae bacterium]